MVDSQEECKAKFEEEFELECLLDSRQEVGLASQDFQEKSTVRDGREMPRT